jgi:hypothetical protein
MVYLVGKFREIRCANYCTGTESKSDLHNLLLVQMKVYEEGKVVPVLN